MQGGITGTPPTGAARVTGISGTKVTGNQPQVAGTGLPDAGTGSDKQGESR